MKIIIKTKSTESRNNILNLLTKNLKYKCSCVPGFYNVDYDMIDVNFEEIKNG